MTKKKPDPMKQAPAGVKRPHYACRLREDFHDWIKAECVRLNCSQGVFLEVLVMKAILSSQAGTPLVAEHDVFAYSSQERWFAMGGINGFAYLRSEGPNNKSDESR